MPQIRQINILDMIEIAGEDACKAVLSSFVCPLNKDVEDFIHNKAVAFAQQRIAITFLVFTVDNEQLLFNGYYTLANKFVSISDNLLSKTLQKRISKFSQYDSQSQCYLVSMPLIAQLSKNFASSETASALSGTDLLSLACERVMQAQKLIGGKTTYIECSSVPKLYDFYSQNGFYLFGERNKESGELAENPILVQMLRYFKN